MYSLTLVSCNDDEEGMPEETRSSFSINGQVTDPSTGNQSAWSANAVDVNFGAQGLSFKAGVGSDTLYVAIESVDSGLYVVDGTSDLSAFNRYEVFSSADSSISLYTYKADQSGGIVFNILSNDTVNQRISGFFSANYFNPVNNSDFFQLTDATFDISYAPPPGAPVFVPGGGTISFLRDGANQVYDNATGLLNENDIIVMDGTVTSGSTFTSIQLAFTDTLDVDTFMIGSGQILLEATYLESVGVMFDAFSADSGSVIITTHDTINNNISGQFNFKALNDQGTDSIYITMGEFDMNYIE